MGYQGEKLVNKEEMIMTIKEWYDFQLLTGRIRLKYYRLFIKSVPYFSNPILDAFFRISKEKLEEERVIFGF